MDFSLSERTLELREILQDFMDRFIYPNESVHRQQIIDSGDPYTHTQILDDLKVEARKMGLWNLFLPYETEGSDGLSNVEYATLAEVTGRSLLAPEAINCGAPDSGNMELLHMFGTPEQKSQWLSPLLSAEIRSCFAMTEPGISSSDATNVALRIERDGDSYVLNGRKWWSSGAPRKRCRVAIVMGKTDPTAPTYRQQSMILVPLDTPGLTLVRSLPVFGYKDNIGHSEFLFEDVRVPATNMLGEEGSGFEIAQARLGPGRIHHCMRAIGAAERALELMCRRVQQRVAFGKRLAEQGVIQEWIAESRIEIEQARLLVLKTAWLMDTVGNKGARTEISAIKVVAPNVALRVVDRAIQAHGGEGLSADTPLAEMYARLRPLRLGDGPDEVHRRAVARQELRKYRDLASADSGS